MISFVYMTSQVTIHFVGIILLGREKKFCVSGNQTDPNFSVLNLSIFMKAGNGPE